MGSLYTAGFGIILLGMVAAGLKWIRLHTAYGVMALSQVVTAAVGFITGNTVAASISAAAAGYLGWRWWNDGGGDGTKRRLAKAVRRFDGVRRTAPEGAS
jgi:hypothetical protein